ncbi:MAG: lipocalin-like domain-containing protein [Candidatus Competibacteraceae bacterium]
MSLLRSIVGLVPIVACLLQVGCYSDSASPSCPATASSVPAALSGEDFQGYQRAYAPRPLVFPADHGSHPDFRTEWWYVTGNLMDDRGHAFGYQLTLFRLALTPHPAVADSAWRTNQIYMGHFAITDVTGRRHYHFERFSRAALGLAGAQASPFRVWLDDWSLQGGTDDAFPLRLQAQEQELGLDLFLESVKPLVLQGDRGLSQKSDEPGNASYYYSATRLRTRGTLTLAKQRFTVSGFSWLDHEWSTSALGPEQSGWDWFALQLDDGRELMMYRLRLKSGGMDPHGSGVLVDVNGATRRLNHEQMEFTELKHWTSAATGRRYPIHWRVRIPTENLELTVSPPVEDQEMRNSVHYWEGAVTVTGRAGDKPIDGRGYLEMTGYSACQTR